MSSVAQSRVSSILSQLQPSPVASSSSPRPDDVVIVCALRTPVCKAGRGPFKDSYPEDLLSCAMKGVLEKTKIQPAILGDIIVGSVLGHGGQRANECRIAAFLAGIPDTVPVHLVNRQCSSGLQAIAQAAASIKAGYYEVALACGVEHMSSGGIPSSGSINPRVLINQQAKDCLIPMGITSERVAARYGVSRADQDKFAAQSHARAFAAIKAGKFKDEIVPVKARVKDRKTGNVKEMLVEIDDGVRADTTVESLAKLKPAFDPKGSTTAGNASQVSDGAAVCLVASRAFAEKQKLPILATFRSYAVTGVPPDVMGIGPATAIPEAVKKAGISLNDVDVYEINEAFASQALYCVRKLGLDEAKVNPNGGAIALGHALGCTGARQTATLIQELKRRNGRFGVVSMCIGSGM
jgi:acetyl-CoA acyltransferase 1